MTPRIALLFDLDGTLIHSSADLAVAANRMLSSLDLPEVRLQQVEQWIGHGVERLVHRCITGSEDGEAEEELARHGLEIFRAEYLRTEFERTRLADGAIEVLDSLRNAGYPCALVTNKTKIPTLAILEKFHLAHRFESVVCGDTLDTCKPDAAPLKHALLGCGTDSGWMVGDSGTDATASGAAGLPFIAIRGGYGPDGDPESFSIRPALVLESLRGLLDLGGAPREILARPSAFS